MDGCFLSIVKTRQGGISNEQHRVFVDSTPFGKNAKRDRAVIGHFPQGRSKFRAGVEKYSGARGTPGFVSSGHEEVAPVRGPAVLEEKGLSHGEEEAVSGVGV